MKTVLQSCVLLTLLAVFPATQARPSKDNAKKQVTKANGDIDWQSKWWTSGSKEDSDDSKDGWKIFKLEKPAVWRRWWEEDWEEDDWWAPKESSTISSKPGEHQTLPSVDTSKQQSKDVPQLPSQQNADEKPSAQNEETTTVPEPYALPLISESKLQGAKDSEAANSSENQALPAAETPREKMDPAFAKDTISPFEDPSPGLHASPKDEVAGEKDWGYHSYGGLGKYVSNDVDTKPESMVSEKKAENLTKKEDIVVEKGKIELQIQKEDKNKDIAEDKESVVDQFYGFGLEADPLLPLEKKIGVKTKQTATAEPKTEKPAHLHNKENYNQGVIFDKIPGETEEKTHSVKKDLGNQDYMKDFVNTKANPHTSPNPAPPGLANKNATQEETTTLIQTTHQQPDRNGEDTKKEPAYFIKSHPLTYCKFDGECRSGRMCKEGLCVCLPEDGCEGHWKPVCGSDGVKYSSHCELHRTACVKAVHIKVDMSNRCMASHEAIDKMKQIEELQQQKHLLPQASKKNEDSTSKNKDDDSSNDEEEEEDDFDDEWFKDNSNDDSEETVIDSSKIYNYTKDLKKVSSTTSETTKKPAKTLKDFAPWDYVKEETGEEFEPVKTKEDHEDKEGYQQDASVKTCDEKELAKFKEELLAFHCKRFEEPDCKLELQQEREYLSKLMFSYLDKNTDYQLDYNELNKQKKENFKELSPVCVLTDLIWYEDTANADGQLSLDEFIAAFNHKPVVHNAPEPVKTTAAAPVVYIIPTLATVGNGLELKCGLASDSSSIMWRRHGVNIRDLSMIELLVLDDGSLFFSKMGVHHMGNYSCEDSSNPSVIQVHALKVQMPPIVKVSPHSLIKPSKVDEKIKCHAEGVPKPTVSWQINGMDLPNEPDHYTTADGGEILTIHKTDYERDTGAYKCLAKNQAGSAEDIASLFVIGDKERTVNMGFSEESSGTFVVFHDQGYTAYNPDSCLQHRNVHGDFGYFKFIPDNLDSPLRLCEENKACEWGGAVNVRNSFVYVTQPALNRVVVIETTKNWIPIQVVATDKRPMQVHYVEHLDQVWVLCWNGEEDDSSKTIIVVRDASKFVQHRAVHTQPVGNRFDQVQDLFIPPPNDLHHSYNYGYITHSGQRALTKLDLDNMRYVKAVDLSPYDCVPHALAFVPIGGHVVVQCTSPVNHQMLQLVLDYITDAVISTTVLPGRPYVSPDSRHVVTVDDLTGKVSVTGVSNEGVLEPAYEVTVSASISDVDFFPLTGHGYLLVLTSADDDDIIIINLATGKVEKTKGTTKTDTSSDWHPSPVTRTIVSGDVFSDFLLAPSKSSLSIVDIKFRKVQCEYSDIQHGSVMAFVGQQ